nr:alanine racemase [Adlercreutzia sp. ZJ242]
MSDIPNGFTSRPRHDAGFVSASDAIKKAEAEAAAKAANASRDASASRAASAGWQVPGARDGEGKPEGVWGKPSAPTASRAMGQFLATSEAEGAAPSFDPDKLATIPETDRRWAWVEIDLAAIRHNAMAVKSRLARGCRLMAVVKADAYGHGAVRCAKTALNSGAEYLGVATVNEAVQLREALVNAPILILGEPPISSIPLLLAYKIMPSVYTAEFAIQYAEAADSLGLRAPFHLKVNTGMNRIGVRHDEVVAFMHQVGFHRALDLVGTFTHFATADCAETLDFQIQAKRFLEAVNALRAAGVDPGIVHAANSAAGIRYPEVHFDMVRLGISLYGFYPCPETYGEIDLRPAMSVHARVTDAKLVPMSEGVSYGMHYRSPGSVKICTVPIGYADGLRRGLSGNTDFIVDGKAFRQVGNICMDQCMFEVDLRTYATRRRVDPQIGDEVLIVGEAGDAVVTIDEMADKLGTIQHEIAIGFGCSRLPRIYR